MDTNNNFVIPFGLYSIRGMHALQLFWRKLYYETEIVNAFHDFRMEYNNQGEVCLVPATEVRDWDYYNTIKFCNMLNIQHYNADSIKKGIAHKIHIWSADPMDHELHILMMALDYEYKVNDCFDKEIQDMIGIPFDPIMSAVFDQAVSELNKIKDEYMECKQNAWNPFSEHPDVNCHGFRMRMLKIVEKASGSTRAPIYPYLMEMMNIAQGYTEINKNLISQMR